MTDTLARLSVFATHNTTQAQRFITPEELAQMAQEPRTGTKTTAPLITPYHSASKTADAAQAAMYAAVIIDHDDDNKTESEIRTLYGAEGLGVCYLAFTTSSHSETAQRWKVVVPFAYAVDADPAAQLSAGIAYSLASDPAQARKQQGFYAPNKLTADAAYTAITDQLGEPWEWLHPDDAESVFIQEAVQGWQEYQDALEHITAAAKPKPRPEGTPSASAGIIGQIQQAYSLAELLERNGYKRKGSGLYLSPYSSSGIAGVKVLERDGKQVVYSHHGPACPLSAENHGGHALDVADALCALQYGDDFAAMIREQASDLDQQGNKQRQREYMQERERQQKAEAFNSPAGALARLDLEQPGTAAPDQPHPLTRIVDIGKAPEPPAWLLPGFIAEGVAMIAGGHGAGKTTALLPLALAVAGVHPKEYELAPEHWRHVIYITEDTHQAQRIITGYGRSLDWPGGQGVPERIKERLHIVEACRAGAGHVAQAGAFYREQFTRTVTATGLDGLPRIVELLPLVVIDTLAATIHLENENDNSEASAAIAILKQRFEGLPVWIVGHTAKANLARSDAVTARGASAWEADANQVLYLVNEAEKGRWLMRGKTRFESPWPELEIHSHSDTLTVTNRFGQEEVLTLRWAIPTPPQQDRTQRSEQAQADRQERDREALRAQILEEVARAFERGERLNKNGVCGKVPGSKTNKLDAISGLLSAGLLYEVEIPLGERQPNRPSFLVALTEEEQAELKSTGTVPEHKLEIPPGWKKPPKPEAKPEPEVVA